VQQGRSGRSGRSGSRLTERQIDRIKAAMRRAGLTQRQIAEAFSYNESAVSKWFHGETAPPQKALNFIAGKVGVSPADLLDGEPLDKVLAYGRSMFPGSEGTLNVGEVISAAHGDRGRPVYDGAGCGNPVASDESERPIPLDFVELEGEHARMVGSEGFGVRIHGESMANWGFHEGATLWVRPDWAPRVNYPVLALVELEDGTTGMAVKLLKQHGTERFLANDGAEGNGAISVKEATLIGPVVWHQPPGGVPRRVNR
jgi:hypothetical protein